MIRSKGGDEAARSPTARKEALREQARRRLAAVPAEVAALAAERVAARVLELPEIAGGRRVATCLSFGTELDSWRLAALLLGAGKELYVPRADPRDRQLHLHRYPCELVTLAFGLKQPPRHLPELDPAEADTTLDACLVLGLAFDRRGYRLGHGSGYFDRFLAGRPFPAIAICHDFQLVDRLPAAAHDVPMAIVVTDHRTLRVGADSQR